MKLKRRRRNTIGAAKSPIHRERNITHETTRLANQRASRGYWQTGPAGATQPRSKVETHLNIMMATLNTGDRQNFANNAYPTNWTPDLQNIYKADQDTCIQVQTYFKNNADTREKAFVPFWNFFQASGSFNGIVEKVHLAIMVATLNPDYRQDFLTYADPTQGGPQVLQDIYNTD